VSQPAPQTTGIFISYRRRDTAYPAGWLYERLITKFGRAHVFKDVDSIRPGEDFVEVIRNAVLSCHTMLVLIGPDWRGVARDTSPEEAGAPPDFLRLEVETALANRLQVIPILIEDAPMPKEDDLPSSIAALSRRNAITLDPNHFDTSFNKLLPILERARREAEQRAQEQARAEAERIAKEREAARLRAQAEQRAASRSARSGEPAGVADGPSPPAQRLFRRFVSSRTATVSAVVVVVLAVAVPVWLISRPSGASPPASPPAAVTPATATSANELGGMANLIAAAQKEGALNVIALPPDWANYAAILKTFTDKYGIKINSANPDGSSQDEINAVKQLGTQDRAPDVLDIGQTFADGNDALFAPYKVATWDSIPYEDKAPDGAWSGDYGGYIAIGCNAKIVPNCPTTFADLLKPEYKGQVALNGDPTQAASAFAGVWAAALANGGSLDDIGPGIAFWGNVAKVGNLLKVDPNSATIESGQTPIVIDWDFLNVTQATRVQSSFKWKVTLPPDGPFAQYYAQAINKNAPHPAAARLWQEFLFSDEGQNLWLAGGSRPVRLIALTRAGTVDKVSLAALPTVRGVAIPPTQAQYDAAQQKVARDWAAATA